MDEKNRSQIELALNNAERASAAAEAIHVKLAAWLLVSNAAGLLAVFNGLIQGQVCDWHAIRPFILTFAVGAAAALLSVYFVRKTHLAKRDLERSSAWMFEEDKVSEHTVRRMSRAARSAPFSERAAFLCMALSAASLIAAVSLSVCSQNLRASLCSATVLEQISPANSSTPSARAEPNSALVGARNAKPEGSPTIAP